MRGSGDLVIEDDQSDPRILAQVLPRVRARCDVLLGPYSTQLMKRAGRIAADNGWLLWNHGGSGDDVETAYPGHVVSVLTPTRSYAAPYMRFIAKESANRELWIVRGKGSFGRQVADGAADIARDLGLGNTHSCSSDEFADAALPLNWDMFSVGTFEDDIELVRRATAMAQPPRQICCIAAGVQEFGSEVTSTDGIFGIAQWFPGGQHDALLGPTEATFVDRYKALAGQVPDYPAVQAFAAAVVALHCVEQAGGADTKLLWSAATRLDTRTLFGRFSIDSSTGAQIGHETTLVRWAEGRPQAVSM
jgi:ABC-type branched-subunit amino acid transport system substrate-binding protein